ncbi:hypothetical protein DFS33DRAFT_1367992 [Desarmillaria ectypa]|nr:hypothetical protein DFS33DRAFT_1367992 [Desarmillaria ectypa]
MESFYCGIYDPATSKQYIPVFSVKLSMRPRVARVDDAIVAVFEEVKDSSVFKRVGKWERHSIQLWKLTKPVIALDWEDNPSLLAGPIEGCATRLRIPDKLSMPSENEVGEALLDFVVVLKPPESEEMLDLIHDLIPRNFQETLSEILRRPTPSRQAKSIDYKDHQSKKLPIFDGRYDVDNPQNTEGLPISLYNPVFSQFRTEFAKEDLPVPKKVMLATVEVIDVSSAIYSGNRMGEKRRREALAPALSEAIGYSIERIVNSDNTDADGTILHRVNGNSVALLQSEIKDEIGTGGSDPSIQGGLSVRRFWAQTNRATYRDATCCPTLILAVAGPWMAVFGAVFTDKFIVEPLTDLIRVVNLSLNSPHYRRIARLFHVFGNCLTSLAKYWDTLVIPPVPVTSMEHPRYFPHVNSYTSNNSTTSFRYLRPIDPQDTLCVTFLAETADPSPTRIIVKFVEQYGAEAHQLLADADLAPKLLYHGVIDSSTGAPSYGSLRMVVMEEVEGTNAFARYQGRKAPQLFVDSVREAIHKLHDRGLVFGDLRHQNIMITRDDKVKLIDFDWAGKDGEAEYPMRLSKKIQWAPGVRAMEKMYKAHDIFMIDQL